LRGERANEDGVKAQRENEILRSHGQLPVPVGGALGGTNRVHQLLSARASEIIW
jgi:hypothetical protein